MDILGTILGILENLIFFDFLETFRRLDPPWNTGQNIFYRKNHHKTCSKQVWTFWERFWAFLDFWKFFNSFKNISKTRPSVEHWAKKFFEKITQNLFKTCLDTFENDFGHSWKLETFLIFWKHFEASTLYRTLGKKSFPKKVPQKMFITLLDSLGTILIVFGFLIFFKFL